MFTGIIIGILIWQFIMFILVITDKLDSDAGYLTASGIFGIVAFCITRIFRLFYKKYCAYILHKKYIKGILYDEDCAIQAFYIPKKDIDFFCTDETQKSYIKIIEAERRSTMPRKSEIMTIEKATNGMPGWSSKYMAKFIKNS